jgi:hypothetical protein
MINAATENKPIDPMEPWREMRDVYLDAWSKTMVDMVNREDYAQASGAMLDSYLTVSIPFREVVEKAMLKTLEQLAMPSRADVISIADRMTNIEMRLDDMDAKLDKALAMAVPQRAPAHREPSRAPHQKKALKTKAAKRRKT